MQHILEILYQTYPDSKCSLEHSSAFQLLISTMLSAQCTDERVNKVTPELFRFYLRLNVWLVLPWSIWLSWCVQLDFLIVNQKI